MLRLDWSAMQNYSYIGVASMAVAEREAALVVAVKEKLGPVHGEPSAEQNKKSGGQRTATAVHLRHSFIRD